MRCVAVLGGSLYPTGLISGCVKLLWVTEVFRKCSVGVSGTVTFRCGGGT